MKKRVVLLVLACSMAFVSQGQVVAGLKGGIGNATARGKETQGKLSYKAGIAMDIGLAKFFSICPALYFSSKGYEKPVFGGTLKANSNFLELPLNFAFKLPLSKKFKLSLHVGPYVAYGIAGTTKLEGNSFDESWKTFEGGTFADLQYDAAKRFDWGGTAGFNIELFFLHVGINYDLGLRDIYSIPKIDRKEAMKNGMWWVSVALLF